MHYNGIKNVHISVYIIIMCIGFEYCNRIIDYHIIGIKFGYLCSPCKILHERVRQTISCTRRQPNARMKAVCLTSARVCRESTSIQTWNKIYVNVYVYSLISPWLHQTLQFTSLVLELSLTQSHLLWGEFNIYTLCCSYSQSLQFQLCQVN